MDPNSPLPIPDSGLPPGWSLEQWNAYGHVWIKQQERETQIEPVSVQSQSETTTQTQTGFQQPIVMWQTPQQDSVTKVMSTVVIVSVSIVCIIILAGVLYVFTSSLASAEIEGSWYNPAQTFTYSSGGELTDSTNTFDEWRVDGNMLYMVDPSEPEYEYYFRYTISDDVLFLAPIDYDDTVKGEDCSAYSSNSAAIDVDVFEEEVSNAAWPSWCTPE